MTQQRDIDYSRTPCKTRDGREVTGIYEIESLYYPWQAVVNKTRIVLWDKEGRYPGDHGNDLIPCGPIVYVDDAPSETEQYDEEYKEMDADENLKNILPDGGAWDGEDLVRAKLRIFGLEIEHEHDRKKYHATIARQQAVIIALIEAKDVLLKELGTRSVSCAAGRFEAGEVE